MPEILFLSRKQTYPSSISKNLAVEPESLDMKAIVPIVMPVFKRFWAVMIGPMVFVVI